MWQKSGKIKLFVYFSITSSHALFFSFNRQVGNKFSSDYAVAAQNRINKRVYSLWDQFMDIRKICRLHVNGVGFPAVSDGVINLSPEGVVRYTPKSLGNPRQS